MNIRKAIIDDLSRVAEIYVFNNRINFFPIFKDEVFSFGELQVVPLIDNYFKREDIIENIYVYDNGIIKGFIQMNGAEICKLYVDTSFQSEGIGNELIEFAVRELYADNLWALEKNVRAISFYQRHGVADGLFCREIDGLFCRSSPDIIVRRRCVLSHKRRGWLQPSPSFRYSRNLALQDELYHPVINNGPAVLVCVDKRLGTGPVNQSRDAG